MVSRRWWDVAVGLGSTITILTLLFGFGPDAPVRIGVGVASILLFALDYVLIARAALGGDGRGWRWPAFTAVAAIALGVGAGAAGFVAVLQALMYPLVWVLGDTRRRGVIGSAVLAVAVFCGILIGGGLTTEALLSASTTAVFSFGFAVALGLWIAGIAAYAEEKERLLTQLTAAQAEVEALSRERGAAAERERLGRDIHDTLAQTLAGLVILAERAGRQSRGGDQDAAAATIATVEGVAREALGEARALVARNAAVPSEAAFGDAASRLVERFRTEAGLTIDLDLQSAGETLDRDSQVVLLRCLQEALANVRKHSRATHVRVRVACTPDGTAGLDVVDDGRGFDADADRAGFGLDGMKDRVALAGGTFTVASRVGGGTTVSVRLPARVTTGDAS